jgi:hypothetical protein
LPSGKIDTILQSPLRLELFFDIVVRGYRRQCPVRKFPIPSQRGD